MQKRPTILLLAGQSLRMGRPKGLLKVDKNTYWPDYQLEKLRACPVSEVIVVFGHHIDQYFKSLAWAQASLYRPLELEGLKVRSVINLECQQGPFSSLVKGLELLPPDCEGAFVLPVDNPVPPPSIWKELIAVQDEKICAAIPSFEKKGGHPVLLSGAYAKSLCERFVGDKSMRLDVELKGLAGHQKKYAKASSDAIHVNFNYPADFRHWVDYKKDNYEKTGAWDA